MQYTRVIRVQRYFDRLQADLSAVAELSAAELAGWRRRIAERVDAWPGRAVTTRRGRLPLPAR